ncbi:antibiotic biosynthesis monooxygenase [Bacillus sp. BRMEA1]|uniref:antibiotic biosynthesis monooxygenase family protein n=1 Tax=Neobacillus endophyticus TaxID=2738405 RepID=UPI001564804B|nr:antibiotic biosynthesis monooxygenase [Neobacillus endophyticus]NRD78370.1 antibiotic biosynthesis monooxygenase [Neobacillus endophyticus]
MNIYMTIGTLDFLKKIQAKYPNETMVPMLGTNGALLLHETKGKTVFSTPRKYVVLESIGEIGSNGLVIMNNIPVTDEGRPIFEHQFKNRVHSIENETGFIALRFLRPQASRTYVMIAIWENKTSYENWKSSSSCWEKDLKSIGKNGANLFDSSPHTNQYTITE